MKKFKFRLEETSRDFMYEYQAEKDEVVNIVEKGSYIVTLCNNKKVSGPYAADKAIREINCTGVPVW